MISWISGDLIESWETNQKYFVLINCRGLGYEIQLLESFFLKLKSNQISKKNIIFWIKHIKREDSDLFFGFISKDQKDFFIEIINIRGIGSQIAMSLLNKLTISEVIHAIKTENKKLICSVPGIGQKMAERLILELKGKFNNELIIDENSYKNEIPIRNNELNKLFEDLHITLKSLNYTKKEIKNILPILEKEKEVLNNEEKNISFESLLKFAMNHLENDSGNIVR